MRERLKALREGVESALKGVKSHIELEALRVRFLGKKGELTAILKSMGTLDPAQRPEMGALANEVREYLEREIEAAGKRIADETLKNKLLKERLDVTLPGVAVRSGHRHPMRIVLEEIEDIFLGMGFNIAEGPEVESCYYCFDALNTGQDHPARDMRDTFYMDPETILRTQTSSVQIRTMERQKPPVRIISPGRVYRKDEFDATHSPMFHQVEGLVVDAGITFADLKGTLETMMKSIFGHSAKLRFRPHHFPYTEPSAEVDLQCFVCRGEGCQMCKQEGYIEMLGSGMVHPNVLSVCGIDPGIYSGFAFGVGLERLTLMRYGIRDMRLLFENDVRFLEQF